MIAQTSAIPDNAPMVKSKGVPNTFKPVQLESHLFPTLIENIGTVLNIDVGYVPGTILASLFKPAVFPANSGWGFATLTVEVESHTYRAFLMTTLETAIHWGASGLQRPAAARQHPQVESDGSISFTAELEQDFSAFQEVCNVIACGVLARAWQSILDQHVIVVLESVAAVSGRHLPELLNAKGLIAIQGIAGYSDRKLPPETDGTPVYEHHTAFLLIVPALLGVEVLWEDIDGSERQKTEWLIKTGEWRWKGR